MVTALKTEGLGSLDWASSVIHTELCRGILIGQSRSTVIAVLAMEFKKVGCHSFRKTAALCSLS